MKKLVLAMFTCAMIGTTAHAATLIKAKPGQYPTRLAAAQAAAAYHADKAAGAGVALGRDFSKISAQRVNGKSQKLTVADRPAHLEFTVTTVKRGAKDYTAYLPNRNVYTPINAGQ
jgi:hypothetical protein